MKPHLKRLNGYWTHSGQGVTGYGVTADGAYRQWLAMLPGRRATHLPPMPHDSLMLAALKAWQPSTAH
jgi:hypothetical protein